MSIESIEINESIDESIETVCIKLSREEIKKLSLPDKIQYQRQMNVERQRRYKANNKEKFDKYHKNYVKEYRKKHADKYRELNKKNSKIYREKMAEQRKGHDNAVLLLSLSQD